MEDDKVKGKNKIKMFSEIRAFYNLLNDETIKNYLYFFFPSEFRKYLEDTFTVPEKNAWESIRYENLPFYPEFPVDKYFLDFADPINKLGIEIFGNSYHQNPLKDFERLLKLRDCGWYIFVIFPKGTNISLDEHVTGGGRVDSHFSYTTSDGLCYSLRRTVYKGTKVITHEDENIVNSLFQKSTKIQEAYINSKLFEKLNI